MKLGMMKDIDWEYVGALLAQEDDDKQIKFFKAFVKECNSWGTNFQIANQMIDISNGLTVKEKTILSTITYIDEDG